MHDFVPDDIADAQWYNIGNGVHVLGVKDKSKTRNGSEVVVVDPKFAMVRRRKDGAFEYKLNQTEYSGLEPSKDIAIDKVNNLYLSAMQANEKEKQVFPKEPT